MATHILAHDLGTTGVKALLFGHDGRVTASAFEGYATHYPRAGWAEQAPADWWDAICAATRRLLQQSQVQPADVAAVSYSGQMMACLPIDAAGQPVRSAIIWADVRAAAEADQLAARVGRDRVYALTGHRPSASYTAAKALWVRAHQPDLWARTAKLLQPKDYLAYRLSGALATDYSDASGTNLFALAARRWSPEILDAIGLPASLLPDAVPAATVIGHVTPEAARATGLAEGTPVVIGGGDGACATVGAGVVRPGDAYTYIGSSSWIAYVSPEPVLDPLQRVFTFAHLDPAYLFPTGTMQCAGGSYDWLVALLRGDADAPDHAALDALAASVPPGAGGLVYLPYLMGERSPHWNPRARGAYLGLTMAHGRAEVARATLEGVALNLGLILAAFREAGAALPSMRVIGGGARSATWRQILADVFGLPLQRPRLLAEATALGAAIAGGVAVGVWPGYEVAAQFAPAQPAEQPDPARVAAYQRLRDRFAEAYARLEPWFDALPVEAAGSATASDSV